MRLEQSVTCIRLQLQKVVLVLPYKRNVLKLLEVIRLSTHLWAGLPSNWVCFSVLVGNQEVVYELLAPLDDAFDNMQREHP